VGVKTILHTGFFFTKIQVKVFPATFWVVPRVLHVDPFFTTADAWGNVSTNRAKTIEIESFLKSMKFTFRRILELISAFFLNESRGP
jgi:hypothetical protein